MRLKHIQDLALSVALAGAVFALTPAQKAAAQNQYPHVSALEQAILHSSYAGEDLNARLSRMEIKAFGAPSKDPDFSARTDALQTWAEQKLHASFPEMNADNTACGDNVTTEPQTSGGGQQYVGQQPQDAPPASDDDLKTDYPRVDALEKDILGQSYPGQPLSNRLARMETKAFGKPSTSDDLGDRTDALQNYAANTLHKGHAVADDSDGCAQATATGGSSSGGEQDYPRVDALEKAILGQEYMGQPLAQRLGRMEVTAFGKASDSDDLGDRTDALEKYADKKLHKKITQDNQAMGVQGGQDDHPIESKVASFLEKQILGMAGGGLPMGGVGGMPFGGMGSGLMPGFGGIRARPRQQQEQQNQAQQETKQDDPAVWAPGPPPSSARLLTKVGWCEVRTFGHPFPKMHLEERLGQLNSTLNFEPGKTDLELMDHINRMMKVVESRPAAQNMAASPATTH